MQTDHGKLRRNIFIGTTLLICLGGVMLRFYRITTNNFFFFDEGLYLDLHRKYLDLIAKYPPKDLYNILRALHMCMRLALGEGKALWFFISHVRAFWGGVEDWYFPRLVSAVSGSLTVFLTFIFARRFLNSRTAGWLSLGLLALLPSHVFYSRLGLQEGFCTLLFLLGFYFYLFPPKFGYRTFISAIFFALAFFSNYRLIIIPVFVLFVEIWTSLSNGERPSFRKYMWHTLIFLFLVFAVGGLDQGQNTLNTFAWMWYQSRLAGAQFEALNFLSYPYYIFSFEGILFGIFFFGNIFLLFKRQWRRLFPFLITGLAMLIFSFTADKGARYICVMLPFAAMAVASLIEYLFIQYRSKVFKIIAGTLVIFMVTALIVQSTEVAQFKSDYESSIAYLKQINPEFVLISTQWRVQGLFLKAGRVFECPKDFKLLARLHTAGARYLVVDPQAYISWTKDGNKFTEPLMDYLEFLETHAKPIRVFPHFSEKMLARFVFEHNDNLGRSLAFLNRSRREHLGVLKIYDLKAFVDAVNRRLAARDAARKR